MSDPTTNGRTSDWGDQIAPSLDDFARLARAAFDALPPPPPDDDQPVPRRFDDLAGWCRNDLWPAALSLAPDLARIHEVLERAGAAPA